MKILICGFSGAGKTTWLKKLKSNSMNHQNVQFLDLDHMVAIALGISENKLGEWIISNGEPSFREFEKQALLNQLSRASEDVIALGGGSLSAPVMDIIKSNKQNIKLVYLNEKIENCISRIKKDPNKLLSKLTDEKMIELYQSRLFFYQQADLIVNPDEIKLIEGLSSLVHNLSIK